MSTVWITVIALGIGTIAIRAAGPVLLGSRELPPRLAGALSLLPPAVLAALVVTQTMADGEELVLDARIVGIGAAGIAIAVRAPLLVTVLVAAGAAALTRALGWG